MCAAVISANLPTFRPCLRVAANKLGFTRFQYKTETTSGQGSGKMNNTIGSGGKSLSFTAASARRSVGNVFGAGRLPQDSDMHGIMDEEHGEHGYRLNEWPAGSEGKATPSASAVEVDTDREGSITLHSIHKVSSAKDNLG